MAALKKTIISMAIIAALASGAAAWTVPYMAGGVSSEGGAASGYYDPDGDISYGDWVDSDSETTNLYAEIDDSVRSPTAPTLTDYVLNMNMESTYEGTLEEITGSITSMAVRLYLMKGNTNAGNYVYVSISREGTSWTAEQQVEPSNTAGWMTASFAGLSWSGTTDFRMRLRRAGTNAWIWVYAAYAEASP